MSIDPDKELFDSGNGQPPASPPPPPPEDDDEPRKRTMSEEIEGGSDGQQTLHLSVSFQFADKNGRHFDMVSQCHPGALSLQL